MNANSPMMAQYLRIKHQYSDCLLFYQMGDFYELFFDDAVTAAKALGIVLSKRGKRQGQDIPMCGVPVITSDGYLQTLIRKGFRVAVCEQTEDASEAKKRGPKAVVAREVVRVVTPGTLTEDELLDARSHNFLAAVAVVRGDAAVAWTDISVGSLHVTPCSADGVSGQIARISPKELLHAETAESDLLDSISGCKSVLMPLASIHFNSSTAERRLCELFGVQTLDAFGDFSRVELGSLGALLSYLDVTQKGKCPTLLPPVRESIQESIEIDVATRRNLEISRDFSGSRENSLLGAIDYTLTAAGGRLLERRICAPSTILNEIMERQMAVAYFKERNPLRKNIRENLRKLPDINRSLSRLSMNRGGPRDLGALRNGLKTAQTIQKLLRQCFVAFEDNADSSQHLIGVAENETAVYSSAAKLSGCKVLLQELEAALAEELPQLVRDGGFIRRGYNTKLDEECLLRDKGRNQISQLQAEFIKETGIAPLKVKHNNLLGYFIEVPSAQASKLLSPPLSNKYIHRHTVANAKRFATETLASTETRIINAASRTLEIETELFNMFGKMAVEASKDINQIATGLAEIDVATAWAHLADDLSWCQPKLDHSGILDINGGRHPVVERSLRKSTGQEFIANDCRLADLNESPRIRLITGPNMAGKSTYLRQNALIVLLAQAGSFVPAESAHIGLVSQLFSRVGASDELARGRSTFMVEMLETAAILNQAKSNALVILDEIGRGTATYDGLSIAWSTLEHLHDVNRCRALFATHYHELTQLTNRLPRISNANVSVREWKNDIVFLYEVKEGAAERSYGVQVAQLAGMPALAIARAREILDSLETDEHNATGRVSARVDDLPLFASARESPAAPTIAPNSAEAVLQDRLNEINADELSPRDALLLIYELKKMAADKSVTS